MAEDNGEPNHLESTIQSQEDLNLVASSLGIKYQVEDNLSGGRSLFSASITLSNKCKVALGHTAGDKKWSIYFSHMRMVEPTYLPVDDSVDLDDAGVRISHLNGCIFELSPLKSFKTLKEGDSLKIKFNGQHYSASRSDILPNWYLCVEGLEPQIIKSTEGESLDFVGPFDTPMRYKRFDYTLASGKRRYDIYQPFTPEVRFSRFLEIVDDPSHLKPVIPTPQNFDLKSDTFVNIVSEGWSIVAKGGHFLKEAKYLSEKIGISVAESNSDCDNEESKIIVLKKDCVKSVNASCSDAEVYEVVINASKEHIEITANAAPGAFYGVQTLLGLSAASPMKAAGLVPDSSIQDGPRYPFRGMHVDISRNFQTKEEILRLLEIMAMYKLNKFHFHLTDDEGWRLEIPGLEELTEVGSKRGHDIKEDTCLLPLLGSGPFPHGLGCGYYSVEDYKEILRFADDRHIEVIPEIEMPGHSHAAVRSMRVRYNKLMAQNKQKEAEEYLLSDPSEKGDPSAYSVQMLAENSMNPGMESTFTFVDKIIRELKDMHKDIQPLRIFHLGGDEVPYEAWDDSPACHALVETGKILDMEDLMEYFVTRVGELAHTHGLELGAWQDGIVVKNVGPYRREKFPNSNVLVHFWRNVWETGQAYDAYKLANSGYEVVLAPGTHLYFDHPHEPDPEERGLYWACRFVDTHKVFLFTPDNLMSNADVKLTGEKLTRSDLRILRDSEDATELKKPENIIGLQGQIWTELVRTTQQFHEMILPRLIALSERAWHKSPWEDLDIDKRKSDQEAEWSSFAHTLGLKELKRLEEMNVSYHIPPPGARVSGDGMLELRSCYPGQPMSWSVDGGQSWEPYEGRVDVVAYEEILLRASTFNGSNHSRVVSLKVKTYADSDDQSN